MEIKCCNPSDPDPQPLSLDMDSQADSNETPKHAEEGDGGKYFFYQMSIKIVILM